MGVRQPPASVGRRPGGIGDVLLATGGGSPPALARDLADAIARERHAAVHVVGLVAVPRYTPLDAADGLVADYRDTVARTMERADAPATGAVRVGHDATTSLSAAALDRNVRTIVVPRTVDGGEFGQSALDELADRTGADVLLVDDRPPRRKRSSVLVAVAGGPHSALAVDVGRALAAAEGVWVDLLHATTADAPDAEADARALLGRYAERFGDIDRVSTWTLDATDVADTIREQSQYYDLTLVGAPRTSRLRRLLFGSTSSDIGAAVESPSVVVRRAPLAEVVS